MRSLRERLMAISNVPKSSQGGRERIRREGAFYCRECFVPLSCLKDIKTATLEDIHTCDPAFRGEEWDWNRLVFLDIETTGLVGGAGTVAFEIGMGTLTDDGMVIRQYVMRDYDEETAMLRDIASRFERCCAIVTFNGKSFDLPLLESRMIINRIHTCISNLPHLDLLPVCRRVYKLRLGRCNLTALEVAVIGQIRKDDLPGALVPQCYFDYLKTGEFTLLDDVLRHNLQDVQTLAELMGCLCVAFREPERIAHPQDLYGVGRTLDCGGYIQDARHCYKILGKSTLAPQAHLRLATSYKKTREWEEAVQTWKTMVATGEGGTWPYIELAKYYEHIVRDVKQALYYANSALTFSLNIAPLQEENEQENWFLIRRIYRLRRKLASIKK